MPVTSPENRFTVGFVVALFACAVIIVLAVKGDMHPFWNWLHRWSTLIAGFMAVGGAAVTVWQIRKQIAVEAQIRQQKANESAIYVLKWCSSAKRNLMTLRAEIRRVNAALKDEDGPWVNDVKVPDCNFPDEIDPDIHNWFLYVTKAIKMLNGNVVKYNEKQVLDGLDVWIEQNKKLAAELNKIEERIDVHVLRPSALTLFAAGWSQADIDEIVRGAPVVAR